MNGWGWLLLIIFLVVFGRYILAAAAVITGVGLGIFIVCMIIAAICNNAFGK